LFPQLATACLPGLFCPSFNTEIIDIIADGFYSLYGFDKSLCSPGYYCQQGQRQQCPIGFQCPYFGMVLPELCPVKELIRTSCIPLLMLITLAFTVPGVVPG
jgi:hypothetical protein